MSKDQMKLTDARALVAKMVIKSGIPGLKAHRYNLYPKGANRNAMFEAKSSIWGTQYFSFEQAWGVSADLRVEFKDGHTVVNGKKRPCSDVFVKVDWGSTGRTLSEARAVIRLYSDLVDLGSLIEAHVSGLDIESSKEAYERWSKISEAKRAARLQEEMDSLANGLVMDTSDPGEVSKELWEHLDQNVQCECNTAKGTQCKAKGRTGVWSRRQQRFIPTCNRHLEQIKALVKNEVPRSLDGIVPSTAA